MEKGHPIGLSTAQFGLAAGLFFAGYCACEVPSNVAPYAVGALYRAKVRERPKASLRDAVADTRVWLLAVIQFCFTLASYGIGIFLPLIWD